MKRGENGSISVSMGPLSTETAVFLFARRSLIQLSDQRSTQYLAKRSSI
jgi:hypothetical protein